MWKLNSSALITIFLLFSASAFAGNDPETPATLEGGKVITAAEANGMIGKASIFDMRKSTSYDKGHIPGARSLPYDQKSEKVASFDASIDKFDISQLPSDKNAQLVFYSDGPTGWKSYKAAVTSIKAGYKNVNWLRGGSKEWESSGMKLEK